MSYPPSARARALALAALVPIVACSSQPSGPDAIGGDASPTFEGGPGGDAGPSTGASDATLPDAPPWTGADAQPEGAVDAGPRIPPPGCDADRVALAMHPGAEVLDPQPPGAPYTCAHPTGHRAPFNASLVVTDQGTVVYAPAYATGVIRSVDGAQTFSEPLNDPPPEEDEAWFHPWVTRDPDSGRLFMNVYASFAGPCQASLSVAGGTGSEYWYSDDDGATWTRLEGGVGCDSWDWGKIITGPPVTEASRQALEQSGYPNLVYFCAGGNVYALGTHQYCYRSTDGGLTFERAGNPIDPLRGQVGWPNAGAIAPDGTFYKVHGSNDGVSVAISDDEAETWRVTKIPGTSLGVVPNVNFLASNVATDSEGNVYVVWVDDKDTLPYLAISRDGAETWSTPMMVGGPNVRVATNINIAVREPGYVAIDYYGSAQAEAVGGDGYWDNDGRPYDAYITVSTDVFADEPVFWSTTVNDPSTPTMVGVDVNVSEYIGPPAFGPDGHIWAGFLRNEEGLVGRMALPPE